MTEEIEKGQYSSILYSNPNNPSWICLNEEELKIIGEISMKYDVTVIEDLAYFGMDFRKDLSNPGSAFSTYSGKVYGQLLVADLQLQSFLLCRATNRYDGHFPGFVR